jgi:hypothetical protein
LEAQEPYIFKRKIDGFKTEVEWVYCIICKKGKFCGGTNTISPSAWKVKHSKGPCKSKFDEVKYMYEREEKPEPSTEVNTICNRRCDECDEKDEDLREQIECLNVRDTRLKKIRDCISDQSDRLDTIVNYIRSTTREYSDLEQRLLDEIERVCQDNTYVTRVVNREEDDDPPSDED